MEEFEIIAKTFQGLEGVLAKELTALGAHNVQEGRRMVSFTGDQEMLYRANFCLRTAVRVLKPIKHFRAEDAEQVYEAVHSIDWEQYLDLQTSFSVDSVVFSQEFRHSKFVTYKVKDAIVDYFREKEGKRPNISITQPDIRLNIHIAETDCTLSLDSSGDSLHQRGYRVASCEAPLNEVLAAGILRLAGWDGQQDFIDPFCGSGTIAIEAALMARNIYPGVFRKKFGFENWKDFDRDLLDRIYNDDTAEREFTHHIYAYDINRPTLEGAVHNAKSAGVSDIITFQQQDFRKFKQPEEKALMVTNPPYGERLRPDDILGLYEAIGTRLKHEFKGNEAWIISSKEELFDSIGLRPSTKIQLLNGNIECELRKYQLFDGSFNAFRAAGGDVKTEEDRRRNAEKKRFRSRDDSFRRRFSDEAEDDSEEARQYAILRGRHMMYERVYGRKERRDNGADERPRRFDDRPRRFDDRKPRFDDDRKPYTDRPRRFDGRKPRFDDDRKPYTDRPRRFDDRKPRYADDRKRNNTGDSRPFRKPRGNKGYDNRRED